MKEEDQINNRQEMINDKRIAVILTNFGGPQGYDGVKPFLYNLFSDPVILNVSNAVRKPLAWLIANMRDFKARVMYKCVSGVSPLVPISYIQAQQLQIKIAQNNLPIDVFIAFRYCKPEINSVLDTLKKSGYKKVIILPMFPQYSFTTTGSVQLVVDQWLNKHGSDLEIEIVKEWYHDRDYIEAFTRQIERALKYQDLKCTQIVFSAHSIPMFNIDNGDPYEKQIIETAKLIIDRLEWKHSWHIAYQSKVGPIKWLEPETGDLIKSLAKKNNNLSLVMVPISFVCEHVETIFEIGHLYKDIAKKAGINNFVRVPALNTSKFLIQALYNQILSRLEGNEESKENTLVNA